MEVGAVTRRRAQRKARPLEAEKLLLVGWKSHGITMHKQHKDMQHQQEAGLPVVVVAAAGRRREGAVSVSLPAESALVVVAAGAAL